MRVVVRFSLQSSSRSSVAPCSTSLWGHTVFQRTMQQQDATHAQLELLAKLDCAITNAVHFGLSLCALCACSTTGAQRAP